MMNDSLKPTHTVEDYLMRMLVMERDEGMIIAARLAEQLNVAPPTVAMTLRRMARDGYVIGKGRKTLHLTDRGREFGYDVTRRHMLVEWLLVKVLKIPMPLVHEEAHALEHAISPALEQRIEELLGNPKVCPHGNPLPGCEDHVKNWVALSDCSIGEIMIIRRIHELAEDDDALLKFLYENGVLPGSKVVVKEILPFNHTASILVEGRTVALGLTTAKQIFAAAP